MILAANCLVAGDVPARGLPVTEGILNFGKVSERLYRGAQPDGNGLEHLKKLGVKLIINLREPGDDWKDEGGGIGVRHPLYKLSHERIQPAEG